MPTIAPAAAPKRAVMSKSCSFCPAVNAAPAPAPIPSPINAPIQCDRSRSAGPAQRDSQARLVAAGAGRRRAGIGRTGPLPSRPSERLRTPGNAPIRSSISLPMVNEGLSGNSYGCPRAPTVGCPRRLLASASESNSPSVVKSCIAQGIPDIRTTSRVSMMRAHARRFPSRDQANAVQPGHDGPDRRTAGPPERGTRQMSSLT